MIRLTPFDCLDRTWAMPCRPALPMNRANLRCLVLSVGIAIALGGCQGDSDWRAGDSAHEKAKVDFEVSIWTDPGTGCRYLNWRKDIGTHAAAGSLSIRFRADGKPDCPASGMSASGQDPQGLEAKPASPTAESGDAHD